MKILTEVCNYTKGKKIFFAKMQVYTSHVFIINQDITSTQTEPRDEHKISCDYN